MRLRDLALSLDPDSDEPLFIQIGAVLTQAIREGRLRPGVALPGSRALAELLKVHRNTILAAFRELEAEGWIETRVGSGTFVAQKRPELTPTPWMGQPKSSEHSPPNLGFDLPSHLNPMTEPLLALFDLREGLPDVRLFSTEMLARAYHRSLKRRGEALLQYGDPRGHLGLRIALVNMLSERRGLMVDPDQILITRGGRMAMSLVASALCTKGGTIAVEDPGNRVAWETFGQARANMLPVPSDSQGLRMDALETLIQAHPIRLIYLMPQHQFPTGASLSPARRKALLELAKTHRIAILEDDVTFEFHYQSRPILPLASGDRDGLVIHMSSFSKILAPGIRLGFLVAPLPLVTRLASARKRIDWQGDGVLESAMRELLVDGEIQRHIRKVRRIYEKRRDCMADTLQKELGSSLSFEIPEGGMGLWVKVSEGLNLEAWRINCAQRGILFYSSRHFRFDGSDAPHTYLAFTTIDIKDIPQVVQQMKEALPN